MSAKVINIAICDDERLFCSELEAMLDHVAAMLNINVEIEPWYSGEALITQISKGYRADVIFLDIELIRLTGIDVGLYLREELEDICTPIVYVSSKQGYAMQLFQTHPFDFLIKPITEKQILSIMNKLMKIWSYHNRYFTYQYGRELFKVPYDDILYFKSDRHKVIMVKMQEELEYYGKLSDIVSDAPPQFFMIHKSYLINGDYVKKYTFEFVEMYNNHILSISKAYRKEVRQRISNLGKERFDEI